MLGGSVGAYGQEHSALFGPLLKSTPAKQHLSGFPDFVPATPAQTAPLTGNALFKLLAPRHLGALQQQVPLTCSVPLLQAPIPEGKQFTMKKLAPRTDKLARMPEARLPAPPCEPPSRR